MAGIIRRIKAKEQPILQAPKPDRRNTHRRDSNTSIIKNNF
jgi:hypothetical protein